MLTDCFCRRPCCVITLIQFHIQWTPSIGQNVLIGGVASFQWWKAYTGTFWNGLNTVLALFQSRGIQVSFQKIEISNTLSDIFRNTYQHPCPKEFEPANTNGFLMPYVEQFFYIYHLLHQYRSSYSKIEISINKYRSWWTEDCSFLFSGTIKINQTLLDWTSAHELLCYKFYKAAILNSVF